jgi:hypothetical protein
MRYTVENKFDWDRTGDLSELMIRPLESKFDTYLPVSADDFARINKGDVIEVLVTVVPKEERK